MLQGMHAELNSQADTLERVNNHVDTTQQGLANVQASAEKTLGKKGESPCAYVYLLLRSFPWKDSHEKDDAFCLA